MNQPNWSIHLPLLLVSLLITLQGFAVSQPEITVTRWDNQTTSGTFEGMSEDGQSIRVKSNNKSTSFPVSELLRVSFQRSKSRTSSPTILHLRDGSVLHGEIVKGGQKQFTLQSPDIKTDPSIDLLNMVDQIEFPRTEPENGTGNLSESSSEKDVLFENNGDVFKGFTSKITPEKIVFNDDNLGERTFPTNKVLKIDLAPLGKPIKPWNKLYIKIITTSGSRMKGVPVSADETHLTLKSTFEKTRWTVPFQSIDTILIKNGKTTFLSDLDPENVVQRQKFLWLGNKENAPPLPYRFRWRRDQSVPDRPDKNEPLQIHGTTFQKGIGCTPYTKLTYALDGAYKRFQATIGIDDRAQSSNSEGAVVFRVYADGKKVYDSGETDYSDFPESIDVDVSGANTLSLEVDTGTGYLDLANWGGARLIRSDG